LEALERADKFAEDEASFYLSLIYGKEGDETKSEMYRKRCDDAGGYTPTFIDSNYELDPVNKEKEENYSANREKVEGLLSSWFGEQTPGLDVWQIDIGPSLVIVELYGEDEELGFPETLSIGANLLSDVPFDDAIYGYLMTDANMPYIKWLVGEREDNGDNVSIFCGTAMLMSTVTQENLDFVVAQVINCAEFWGDKLKERFGGKLYIDREEE
jgi:hypothetical protein